jgi:hypothetical protein
MKAHFDMPLEFEITLRGKPLRVEITQVIDPCPELGIKTAYAEWYSVTGDGADMVRTAEENKELQEGVERYVADWYQKWTAWNETGDDWDGTGDDPEGPDCPV